ncbi:MAG: asparagine synthase (glutamine-hydrolyzing) [Candidatus Omnitrophota bacterium]|nr:asparagine synthase (glutamine-hydrolyzing) [Candidatus Omnitrophota bacterium]
MCGIVGMLQWDGQAVEEAVLAEALASLSHRGPEGRGQVVLKNTPPCSVGLAHARLKIIDLSEEASQPMSNDDQSVWIVFNGEIYNFLELRASLQQRGVRFRTASDTEVLLRLYEAEGVRCVERLEGMFAFAVWDARHRTLLLGRDRVGKKPLFYYADPGSGRFAFASEIKALLRYPTIVPEVDAEALPAFFLFGYVPTPHTLYRGICQLPPGHLLTLNDDGRLQIEAYWDVPLAAPSVHRAPSEAEAVDRVRELLTAAVRRRLVADVPLGAFLSGGIDSSIIVGLMSRLQREPVRTFSIGFSGDSRFDETRYARLVARHFGTQHTEFRVEPSAVELIDQLVWHYDGPFADSSAIPTYLLAQLTKEHVTVALNGDGGDELFAGYLRFCATLWSERVPLALRRAARSLLTNLPPWGGPRSPWGRLQKFAGSAALPFTERFTRWVAVFYEDLPHLWTGTNGAGAPLAALDPYVRRCRNASPLTQLLYLNVKTYLPDDLLVKADRCSMAHALEARSPFLDRELLEYVFSLPDAMKLRWGRTKVILRQAFTDMLPQPVLRRGKMGFGVPLQRWFRTDLKDFLQDVLLSSGACWRQYLDASYVGSLVEAHVSGRADHSHRLWTLLTFEVWLQNLSLVLGRGEQSRGRYLARTP